MADAPELKNVSFTTSFGWVSMCILRLVSMPVIRPQPVTGLLSSLLREQFFFLTLAESLLADGV